MILDLVIALGSGAALYFLSELMSRSAESIAAHYRLSPAVFFWCIIPWITTLPETWTSIALVLRGYTTAAVLNALYSAVFDCLVVVPLAALKERRLEFPPQVIPYIVATVIAATAFSACIGSFVGMVVLKEAVLLFLIFTALQFIAITPLPVTPSRYFAPTLSIVLFTVSSVATALLLQFMYVPAVERLCSLLGQKIGGILSAVATSLPDVLVAVITGLEVEGIVELSSCVVHDFIETLPLMVIIPSIVLGHPVVVHVPKPFTTILVAIVTTTVFTVYCMTGREVTTGEATLMLLVAIAITLLYVM